MKATKKDYLYLTLTVLLTLLYFWIDGQSLITNP
jgi:hypothetical protein